MAINVNRQQLAVPDARTQEKLRTRGKERGDVSPSQKELRGEAFRARLLGSMPEASLDFLRDNLGLDLRSPEMSLDVLAAVRQGRVTPPVDVTLHTLVYDAEKKETVAGPDLKVNTALRVFMPGKKDADVSQDKTCGVHVSTIPCRPLVDKDVLLNGCRGEEEPLGKGERIIFDEKVKRALEGVGIPRERYFAGPDSMDGALQKLIADGEKFPVDGAVRTVFGMMDICGEARVKVDAKGRMRVTFKSSVAEARAEGRVPDLDARVPYSRPMMVFVRRDKDGALQICAADDKGARKVMSNPSLKLDLFELDEKGAYVLDRKKNRKPTRAGEDLLFFGVSMDPVPGTIRHRIWDADKKKFVHLSEKAFFQVSVSNGSLCAERMESRQVLQEDGTKKEVPQVSARLEDGDKVWVESEGRPLAFVSDRDRADFLAGRGGLVSGASYHDFKTSKDETYKAWVVYDNLSGMARKFTPITSRKLEGRREGKKIRKTSSKRTLGKADSVLRKYMKKF